MHLGYVCFVLLILLHSSTCFLLHPHRKPATVETPTLDDAPPTTSSIPGDFGDGHTYRKRPFYYHRFPHFPILHETQSSYSRKLDEKNYT
ncbi:unnamed protein product [Auanema sp. JU1783]|nr:unnamed protein product [Auanema sp. JU1783]